MVCGSSVGSNFRAEFSFLDQPNGWVLEVLLCSDHTRICEELRRTHRNELMLSTEGFVYPRMWMAALGFLV